MLENKFKTLCQNFLKDEELIIQLWEEISHAHEKEDRHYHTLKHLEQIYNELQELKLTPLLEFVIFYHDIVYDASKSDNEEQSALLAKKRLEQLEVPKELTEKIFKLIIETKTHNASCEENELFLDADLAILASSEKSYERYTQQVRKEYAVYDDATYFNGRKKVLKSFLEKDRIYASHYFYERYEDKARKNLKQELKKLCSP